ncbi:MAG: serine/threonine protein kinase, partial [Gammaproteobacteria bacterium]|nr:serine/threonine protein kinase [Gammaproteobacteria bacterium]
MAQTETYRNALKPGQRVLWFEIERTLGQGGFGITYVAFDTNLKQPVALKEFLPAELAVREGEFEVHPLSSARAGSFAWGLEKFMDEARTLAHFDHPNIVKVYTVFEANNTAYMVMRYEDGLSLGSIYSKRRRLPERLLQHLVHPLLDGLERVHDQGFIHRDIKPDNIYLRQDGSPVLLDFGSARIAVGSETRALTSLVTPGYAPFEQYVTGSDRQGPWSDIYSLGATLYRGIAGIAPPDATNRSEALSYTGKDVLVPALEVGRERCSESFLVAVDAALAFRYDERPQSVAEWRRMFRARRQRKGRRQRDTLTEE